MCISYFIETNTFYKPYGIPVAWCDLKHFNEWHIGTRRMYNTINITGDLNKDKLIISDLRRRLKALKIKDDVTSGVIVVFGNQSNYTEFIEILDVCYSNDDKNMRFAPYGNRLYISHDHPVIPTVSTPSFVFYDDLMPVPAPKPDFFSVDNFKVLLSKAVRFGKNYWAPILVFLLLLYFTFNKGKRVLDLKTFRFIKHQSPLQS